MKKFVSMAMVAAMVVSMVPATAFAGDEYGATYDVVNEWTVRDTEVSTAGGKVEDNGIKKNAPELQIKLTNVATQGSRTDATAVEFTVELDGAKFDPTLKQASDYSMKLRDRYGKVKSDAKFTFTVDSSDNESMDVKMTTTGTFAEGDVFSMDLRSTMKKTRDAFVSVTSDDIAMSHSNDVVYVDVAGEGITANVKKLAKVAEEESVKLEKDLEIKANVGTFLENQVIELKLSNGFEFAKDITSGTGYAVVAGSEGAGEDFAEIRVQKVNGKLPDKIVIDADKIVVEADTAKAGSIATLTVKATNKDHNRKLLVDGTGKPNGFIGTAKVEVAKVVDYVVTMSVDKDKVAPTIYSGVNVNNYGLTDDSDHYSLEVTIEESFPGAWSMRKGFNLELPEGVYVTEVDITDTDALKQTGSDKKVTDITDTLLYAEFEKAYKETDHKGFKFGKRVFDDVDATLADEKATMSFKLQLVADPTFAGPVNLKLKGDLLDEQEVTIANFATPYMVQAEQNDLKIDYRYTAVPTEVVISEPKDTPGLWDKDEAKFALLMEHAKSNFFEFEDADVTVNKESGAGIKSKVSAGAITVSLEKESSDKPAMITISNMEMFMSRSIPAGPYDLEASTTLVEKYLDQKLFAADDKVATPAPDGNKDHGNKAGVFINNHHDCDVCDKETFVGCVADFKPTVKEAFINVVTAGREQDDASFTTRVEVPVGESVIYAGDKAIELDVPAYISAAGYTMLPVRAVATALGINNNNVIWNGESKTVTILYGQRIITMVAGQKVVNVNGSVIPASAAVEIVDGRTFLPMRDLATALGVTDITWDAATKTALLNGSVAAK